MGSPRVIECPFPQCSKRYIDVVRRLHLSIGYYPARFPYQIAVKFLAFTQTRMSGIVLDPFMGSGVACTSARLLGYYCIGFDINPLAVLLADVASSKITPRDRKLLEAALEELEKYEGKGWRPRWENIHYWYPIEVLHVLEKLWGYIKESDDNSLHFKILKIALARTSRYYSYADPEVPKLYKGRGVEKLERMLIGKTTTKIREVILKDVRRRAIKIANALQEYTMLNPKGPKPRVEEFDVVRRELPSWLEKIDIVFTSPPYLAAHEYTRSTKLELYWLGLSDAEVRNLRSKEIPYGRIEPYRIKSETYKELEERIARTAPQRLRIYQNYFWAVTRALDKIVKLSPRIIGLFVGPATIAGIPIPIHEILSQHLTAHGYREECMHVSDIKARKLFRKRKNRNPHGIRKETLIVLTRDFD